MSNELAALQKAAEEAQQALANKQRELQLSAINQIKQLVSDYNVPLDVLAQSLGMNVAPEDNRRKVTASSYGAFTLNYKNPSAKEAALFLMSNDSKLKLHSESDTHITFVAHKAGATSDTLKEMSEFSTTPYPNKKDLLDTSIELTDEYLASLGFLIRK